MGARHQWSRRAARGSIAAVIVAATAMTPVAADTERGHRGVVGEHQLVDSEDAPGATCRNGGSGGSGEQQLEWIRVRPPVAWRGPEAVFLGWRVILQQRREGNRQWKTYEKSPEQIAVAEEDGSVVFYPITVAIGNVDRYDIRVRVRIKWYPWQGTHRDPVGVATHEVDWYRHVYLSDDFGDDVRTVHQYCEGSNFL